MLDAVIGSDRVADGERVSSMGKSESISAG